jgi:hypothetical protein
MCVLFWDDAWCGLVVGYGATSQKSEDLNYIMAEA